MLEHCRNHLPDEACGILAGSGNEVSKIYTMTNIEPSPSSYLMEPKEQFVAMKDMRGRNLSMAAIFHSHPSSPAFPSGRDINLAFYDNAVHIIVGLSETTPSVRAYFIRDGKAEEACIVIK